MEIVPASENDIATLANVEVASKKASIPQLLNAYDTDLASRISRWATWFRGESPAGSRPERVAYKAIVSDQTVGYLSGHLTSRYNCDAEIQSFYILKDYQRIGVGKLLFDQFVLWMAQQGAKSLCVGFDPGNPYKNFYLKQGGRYLNEHWIIWDDVSKFLPC